MIWVVVSNMAGLLSISYIRDSPSETHSLTKSIIFQDGRFAPPTRNPFNIAMVKMTIEIVDLPINSMVIFQDG
jgi:hypothetical protein